MLEQNVERHEGRSSMQAFVSQIQTRLIDPESGRYKEDSRWMGFIAIINEQGGVELSQTMANMPIQHLAEIGLQISAMIAASLKRIDEEQKKQELPPLPTADPFAKLRQDSGVASNSESSP